MPDPQDSPASRVVFFVDDDEDVRSVTKALLERRGFTVIQAGSAEEAGRVAEAYEQPIDVLLMDINLPDGWGAVVAQRLRAHHPEMVTVYTTGFASSDPILSGGLKDAEFVVPKPFTSTELIEMLEKAIARGPEE
ncbi:MAG: response regulator [Longimicrobiales bacterium]